MASEDQRSPRSERTAGNHADEPGEHRPWRVEGERTGKRPGGVTDGRGRPRRSFWLVLAVMFVLNWVFSSMVLAPPPRTQVSYTFFRGQVEAGNVAEITATEDAIEGRFKKAVPYPPEPPGKKGQAVARFRTYR